MHTGKIVITLLLSALASIASAAVYQVSLDRSEWRLQGSPFACSLTHPIPEFGSAVLSKGAGDAVQFWFAPLQPEQWLGELKVYAEPPPWKSGTPATEITGIDQALVSARILLDSEPSEQALAALRSGMQPTLRLVSGEGNVSQVVKVSAAAFTTAYHDYLECVAQLLPVNYQQVARTAILYPPAQWELSSASRERLQLIQQYVATDPSITKIYVDGHSDNQGRRLINRDLSKKRAEEVSRYLVKLGVSEEMLVTRYHGERYPVVPNNSAENRTRNRRVTIRLEREE